jgi:large subunit ribosomal protein L4
MEFQILKNSGTKGTKIKVDKTVFGIKPNETVVHQAIVAELANLRQGTHAAKSRGMVTGSGKKPFRQKGRGMARAGTKKSPLWRSGGVVFPPSPHKYTKLMPKKMRQLARRSALSDKAVNGKIFVIDEFNIEKPKTKHFIDLLKNLKLSDIKVTVLPSVIDNNLDLATRNIPNIFLVKATDVSTYDILDSEVLLFDKAGLTLLNEQLTQKK